MKVVGATEDLVVIDLESDYSDAEFVEYANIPDNSIMLPRILRIFKDRIEIVVSLEQWDTSAPSLGKKTLKIFYKDAILMNRVLHKIFGNTERGRLK